ncbi:hypothetical protein BH11BAC2_BH11BAC2_05180 [soil metagenome]
MRSIIFIFCIFVFAISSCKKDDLVINNNIAPPDTTIENVTVEDYVNRTYILLLGREPSSSELTTALNTLKSSKLSVSSRSNFLDGVLSQPEYYAHNYDRWRVELLNNLDTAEYTQMIFVFNFFLNDSNYLYIWPTLQLEISRLELIQDAYADYASGLILFPELQRRMVDNYFYDQINMGDVNFVLSTFQHFLNRNPTIQEQNSAVAMLSGFNSALFLKAGASKNDYLNIFFNSDDYYEGTVVRMYQDYLLRSPQSAEMSDGALMYKSSKNLKMIQKLIMVSDEFVKN